MANLADILTLIQIDLKAFMLANDLGDAVYIVEAPIDEVAGQYAIQIVSGTDTALHPVSGVGLIRSQLDVVVWWRGF